MMVRYRYNNKGGFYFIAKVFKEKAMLKKTFFYLMLVLALSVVACDLNKDDDDNNSTTSLEGVWGTPGSAIHLTISGDNFTLSRALITRDVRGTFTSTTTHITFHPTEALDNDVWVAFDYTNLHHINNFVNSSSLVAPPYTSSYRIRNDASTFLLILDNISSIPIMKQ
jgi:hypothetical protein